MSVTEEKKKKRKSKELTVEDGMVEESHKKRKSLVEKPVANGVEKEKKDVVETKKKKASDRGAFEDAMSPKKKLKSSTENRGGGGLWTCECGTSNRAVRRNCHQCKKQNPTADDSGDWVCPKKHCGSTNFASRNKCRRCNTTNLSSKDGKEQEVKEEKNWKDWKCNSCSFTNFGSRFNCKQCNVANPAGTTGEEHWACSSCSYPNFASRYKCKQCNEAKPGAKPAGRGSSDWSCSGCGYLNFASRLKCKKCSVPNPDGGGVNRIKKCGAPNTAGGLNRGVKGGRRNEWGVTSDNWECSCGVSNLSFSRCCKTCGASHVMHRVGMSQMPADVTEEDIKKFFSPLEPQSVKLIIKAKKKLKDGELQGKANVLFKSHEEAVEAMDKDQAVMGSCNVKLFLDSTEETNIETAKSEFLAHLDGTLNETAEADESTSEQKKFKWDKVIKTALKTTDDRTMSVKKLRKVLLPQYREKIGEECSKEELKVKLQERLEKSSKFTYEDGNVSL